MDQDPDISYDAAVVTTAGSISPPNSSQDFDFLGTDLGLTIDIWEEDPLRPTIAAAQALHSIAMETPNPYPLLDHSTYQPSITRQDSSDRSESQENGQDRRPKRRGYQACNNCRGRKSACKLGGDPDKPDEPPCKRCRRERRACVFEPTRKKRKSSAEPDLEGLDASRRRLLESSARASVGPQATPQDWIAPVPHLDYTSKPREMAPAPQPGYGPQIGSARNAQMNATQIRSELANDTLHSATATTQDSLTLLYQAATETNAATDGSVHITSPSSAFGSPSTGMSGRPRAFSSHSMTPGHPGLIHNGASTGSVTAHDTDHTNAIRAWERMRFVRAGWFTALEAMQYVDYYYVNLAPMTPIILPDFRLPSKHLLLLTEEPVLAIAILATASRHMKLTGYAAASRAYQIHDKLWTYLRNMVERLLWGQEQFGGGFCGGGGVARVTETKCGQITWKGSLRTLGTIEALLMLTDWQPRALHFPPGDDENRLLDADYNLLHSTNGDSGNGNPSENFDSLPYASWLEPAWRSDRMSWMLLGLAQALSFELGVFDKDHYNCRNEHDPASDCARKRRVRRLVLVYVSQTSGRLGIPSMLPLDQWQTDPIFEKTYQAQRKGKPEDPIDVMQSCWLEIASIMYQANQKIFPSHQFTRDLTASGQYQNRIAEFKPLLKNWKARFDYVAPRIQPLMRYVLIMEYEYARLYINSLGLQKVVESWVGKGNADQSALLRTYNPNREYIEEVADACRTILQTVVNDLGPGGNLRNAPVRTYLRTLSAMMFTLKRFSLGNYENEVRQSVELLEKTTDFLATSVVDDVHLSNQTSSLVKLIVANIRKTFIRIQPPTNGSPGPSLGGSRHQSPHQEEDPVTYVPKRQHTSSQRNGTIRADPLEGITAQPLSQISSAFMPPPSYVAQGNEFDQQMPIDPNINFTDWNTDWLTLPLDRFFDTNTGNVDQGFGGIGPTVGERDMLEILTDQQYSQWNANGSNLFNGFQGGT